MGAEDLTDALNSLDEALAAPMTAENQEAWRTKVNGLKAQVMSIRREINSRNAQMVEKESRLAQEARRLKEESELIEAQKLSLANTRPERHVSRIPPDFERRTLFQSPPQATPPGYTPPRQSTPPPRPDRFHTPPNHYNNPMANVMAATRFLTNLPFHGDTPVD